MIRPLINISRQAREILHNSGSNYVIYLLAHAVIFLVGTTLVQLGGAVSSGIGASLIAAGITGWVVFVHVLLSQQTTQQLAILNNFGFTQAFDRRSMRIRHEYIDRIEHATECIDIMGFGLSALRQDHRADFERWCLAARFRILLLHPEFPKSQLSLARLRDKEEGNADGQIGDEIRDFIDSCKPLMMNSALNGRFQIRLYTCLPSVNIFRIDDELLWGPYFVRDQSRNMPTFVVKRGGVMFERLNKHFNSIWVDDSLSVPVPVEWLN